MSEYEDLMDEAEDEFEQSQDISDSQLESYESTVPHSREQDGVYPWFWKVVRLKKPLQSAKVANLSKQEIGEHIIPVREAMNLAYLGHIFKHATFGNYWATRAKIIASTSMAKSGWFMDLSISQRKIRERAKNSSSDGEKWRLFKKKNKNPEIQE